MDILKLIGTSILLTTLYEFTFSSSHHPQLNYVTAPSGGRGGQDQDDMLLKMAGQTTKKVGAVQYNKGITLFHRALFLLGIYFLEL